MRTWVRDHGYRVHDGLIFIAALVLVVWKSSRLAWTRRRHRTVEHLRCDLGCWSRASRLHDCGADNPADAQRRTHPSLSRIWAICQDTLMLFHECAVWL